jgi:hypothetical protein
MTTTTTPSPTLAADRPNTCPTCPLLRGELRVGRPGAGCCYRWRGQWSIEALAAWAASGEHADANKSELALLLGVSRERASILVRRLVTAGIAVPPAWTANPKGGRPKGGRNLRRGARR